MKDERLILVARDACQDAEVQSIHDSPEELAKALERGFRFRSPYSFSSDPRIDRDCTWYGDLIVEFVDLHNLLNAVRSARDFMQELQARFGVQEYSLHAFIGVDRVRVIISGRIIGCENGDKDLPLIFYRMVKDISDGFSDVGKSFGIIRQDIYSKNCLNFIHIENSTMDGVHYLSSISAMFITNEYDMHFYNNLILSNGRNAFVCDPMMNYELNKFYISCLEFVKNTLMVKPRALECADCKCKFLEYCKNNSAHLSFEAWFAMLTILSKLGILGKEMALSYTKNTNFYNAFEQKFKEASEMNAYSCSSIRNEIFDCGQNCNVESPYLISESKQNSTNCRFLHRPDGLYALQKSDDNGVMKVCSPIEIIALSRDPNGIGWGRIIKLIDPLGRIHTVSVSMSDIITNSDNTLRKLMNFGLQLNSYKYSKSLLLEYLTTYSPTTLATLAKKPGWIGRCYVIKDSVFGNVKDEIFILDDGGAEPPIQEQGTLDEWKENIGNLCEDYPLLVMVVSYALTGFLLEPCGMEGGGLHIFGPSSSGKTTALLVASSVCGGGIKQWRATDNALESVAAMHNDGFLCLDEIGQATSKVVSETTYMLTNGQGKARSNKDGSAKTIQNWRLNFLSTGEITLSDSIAADFGKETMAGQAVRVLDIPSDAGKGHGIFTFVPAGHTGSSFSQLLAKNAKTFYGTPAKAFLEKFTAEFDWAVEKVKKDVAEFVKANCPSGASGQVLRAAQRFGLIAAAGELAIWWMIFPWFETSASAAAKFGFSAWIKQRGGIGDHEMSNAMQRLFDFIESNEGRFVPTSSDDNSLRTNIAGYKWRDTITHEEVYGILSTVFHTSISRKVNYTAFLEELDKKGWLYKNSCGNRLTTKSFKGRNSRVVAVVPERWMKSATSEFYNDSMLDDEIY